MFAKYISLTIMTYDDYIVEFNQLHRRKNKKLAEMVVIK